MALFYAFTDGSPNGPVYEIQVNKGSINMDMFTKTANKRYENGYRIEFVYEQDKNTVVVWMKRGA
jgi:hypothetical protein